MRLPPIQPPPLNRNLRGCQGLEALFTLEETFDQYRLRVHLENALLASESRAASSSVLG